MADQLTFQLGGHSYLVILHPASEGLGIVLQLAELGLEPLGRLAAQALGAKGLLEAVMGSDGDKGKAKASVLDDPAKLAELLSEIDLSALGRDLASALRATPNADRLIMATLKYTTRDNRKLDTEVGFSDAFRGNYGELFGAWLKVVRLNGFFPLPATS